MDNIISFVEGNKNHTVNLVYFNSFTTEDMDEVSYEEMVANKLIGKGYHTETIVESAKKTIAILKLNNDCITISNPENITLLKTALGIHE